MHARYSLIAFVLGCASMFASAAFAQDLENSDDGHLDVKLMLGLGGEAELDVDNDLGAGDSQDDMELGYGLGVAYMVPLHRYFALGGQLAVFSWTTERLDEANADRNMLIDLSLVPQLKYAVSRSVELYASLPLGLTIDAWGEDEFANAEVTGGLGFNLALMLGVRGAIGDSWGLLGELGYVYHAFSHTLEVDTPVGTAENDFDISTGQIGLNAGVWFQL